MFCKIKKNKSGYTVYLCDRKRVDGKVVSKDIKINSFGWHSLYEIDEEHNGLVKEIPIILDRFLGRSILRKYSLEIYDDVVEKLVKIKEEYYPTYKELSIKVTEEFEKKESERKGKRLIEYEKIKNKFNDLHYQEIMEKYKEGYERGLINGILKGNINLNKCSAGKLDIGDQEKKLLKEAFKLLSHKHHPDKGGDTEKMAMINNLKEKIL